jgi:hypothetical protein
MAEKQTTEKAIGVNAVFERLRDAIEEESAREEKAVKMEFETFKLTS